MKDSNYITIQGWMVSQLQLSGNELLLFALIYGFSQDGESEFKGSLTYMCKWLNVTKPTVLSALKSLSEKQLIKKIEIVDNGVKYCYYKGGGKETLPVGSKNSLPGGGKETLPNNTNNITINNKKDVDERKNDFYKEVAKFKDQYSKEMLRSFFDYWTEKNKSGKKMLFELRETFEVSKRLATWYKNDKTPINKKDTYKGFKMLTIDEKNHVGVETKPIFIWTDTSMKNYSMVRTEKEGREYFTRNGERVYL